MNVESDSPPGRRSATFVLVVVRKKSTTMNLPSIEFVVRSLIIKGSRYDDKQHHFRIQVQRFRSRPDKNNGFNLILSRVHGSKAENLKVLLETKPEKLYGPKIKFPGVKYKRTDELLSRNGEYR